MTFSKTIIANGVEKTNCGLCHMGCGMEVHIKDGKISEVKGLRENAFSKGFLCPKGRALAEYVYSPNRITKPLLKQGSGWQEISWDEAMNLIVDNLKKLQETGEEKSLAITEGMPLLLSGSGTIAATHRFAHAFGTPNTFSCESYCYRSKMLAYIATLGQFYVMDPENAACMIIWASDPDQSSPPMGVKVWKGKRNGAKTIVINPLQSKLAAKADHFLQPIPGTDGAILLAMINVIIGEDLYDKEFVSKYTIGFNELAEHVREFTPERAQEISSVNADKIREITRMFATIKPACIIPGVHGLDPQASGFQNNRAIAILQAISGNIDVRGGYIQTPRLRVNIVAPTDKLPEDPLGIDQYPILYGIYGRNFGEGQAMVMIDSILTGRPYPIKSMIVAAANPVITWPNSAAVEKALSKLDFLVVMDQFMTKTARLAHLVLPAATFVERDEISDYYSLWGSPYVMMRKKILQYGECRSDLEFWIDLAWRMGYHEAFPWSDPVAMIDYMLEPSGLSYETLTGKYADGFIYGKQTYKKYEEKGFNTPSGKIEIFSQTMKDLGLPSLPVYKDSLESKTISPHLAEKYPLVLATGARRLCNAGSRFRDVPSLRRRIPEPLVEINPVTAEQYGLVDGDMNVSEPDMPPYFGKEIKLTMTKNVPLETALDLALAHITVLPAKECDLLQAVGRVLAMPLQASVNLPPFDRSPLDGYALRSADTYGANPGDPAVLKIIEEVPAGYTAGGRVESGTAIKIATGAPLPPGADCIIRFEDTRRKGNLVEVDRPLTAGSSIVWAGEDVRKGEVLLSEGQVLGSAEIGLLAALGHRRVEVHRQPRVAVISVGDELEAQAGPLKPGKIYDSNRYALAAGVIEAGGLADIFGPLPDRVEPLQEMLKVLTPEYDLVITTGGVSVGDYDMVPRTFQSAGAETLFWKASFKPGSPVCVALLDSTLLAGLSGNPAAAAISFELLVRPVITRMSGRRDWQRQRAVVTLDQTFERGGCQRRFLRALAYSDGSRLRARLTGSQSPGILKSMLGCNALLDVPGGRGPLRPGDELEAILLWLRQ